MLLVVIMLLLYRFQLDDVSLPPVKPLSIVFKWPKMGDSCSSSVLGSLSFALSRLYFFSILAFAQSFPLILRSWSVSMIQWSVSWP